VHAGALLTRAEACFTWQRRRGHQALFDNEWL